ncbi:MAG: peroxidase-related enzyme [SAR202 cluster bacterium]|nr:peroxidase-related enzyme [SAR202 cluster bacterium]
MAWIEEAETDGQDLPALFRALSLDPKSLESVKQLNEALAFGASALNRAQEEAIATVVAAANQCRYGAMTHSGFLRRHCADRSLAGQLINDFARADLGLADRRMLEFAVKLTKEPAAVTRQDVEDLRAVGFEDPQVLSIVLLTCLYNFMNRLADGLGVDVPPSYQTAMQRWLTGPAAQAQWLMKPKER